MRSPTFTWFVQYLMRVHDEHVDNAYTYTHIPISVLFMLIKHFSCMHLERRSFLSGENLVYIELFLDPLECVDVTLTLRQVHVTTW